MDRGGRTRADTPPHGWEAAMRLFHERRELLAYNPVEGRGV